MDKIDRIKFTLSLDLIEIMSKEDLILIIEQDKIKMIDFNLLDQYKLSPNVIEYMKNNNKFHLVTSVL
jgi:hypothetical protein